jgi:hypothetical protein
MDPPSLPIEIIFTEVTLWMCVKAIVVMASLCKKGRQIVKNGKALLQNAYMELSLFNPREEVYNNTAGYDSRLKWFVSEVCVPGTTSSWDRARLFATFCKIQVNNVKLLRIHHDLKNLKETCTPLMWNLSSFEGIHYQVMHAIKWVRFDPPVFPKLILDVSATTLSDPIYLEALSWFKSDPLFPFPEDKEWPEIPLGKFIISRIGKICMEEADIGAAIRKHMFGKAIEIGTRLHELKSEFYNEMCLRAKGIRIAPRTEKDAFIDKCTDNMEPIVWHLT